MRKGHRLAATVLVIVLLAVFSCPARSNAGTEPQRVLIQYTPGEQASLKKALEQQGATIHYEFDDQDLLVVTLPAKSLNQVQANAAIVAMETDALRYAADQTIPYGVLSVEAPRVWDADADGIVDADAPTGSNRLVCIIDSGVYRAHEDLADVNFVGGYPSNWDTDTCGHGTHVAGTIAAMNNGTGVVGVTPGTVSLYIVKVYGDNCSWIYSSDLINAANRCRDAGANIINMSLGGPYGTTYEQTMFQLLYDQGILLVAAAGNSGGTTYGYPASYDSVISVAAVDQSNVVASFSQQNDQVELAAPGVGIYSTYKDGGYVTMSGTSMATPHVSAAAAVVWSSNPGKTNVEIRNALQQSALDLGAPGRDNAYGFGLVRSLSAIEDLAPLAPTGVDLARFDAVPDGESVHVEWETATEIDNLGFNLYRADSAGGLRIQLNESMIPAQVPGSLEAGGYAFQDEDVERGASYDYWLEDIDVFGAATLHGPVSVEVPAVHKLALLRPRLEPGLCLNSVGHCP